MGVTSEALRRHTLNGKIKSSKVKGKAVYRLTDIEKFIEVYSLPPGNYYTLDEFHKIILDNNIQYGKDNIGKLVAKGELNAFKHKLFNRYFYEEKDVLMFIENYGKKYSAQPAVEETMLSFEEAEKKYGKLVFGDLQRDIIPKYFSCMGIHTFNRLLDDGHFRDYYLIFGVDVMRPKGFIKRAKKAFILNKIKHFNDLYVTLEQASRILDVPYGTLTAWSYNGYFESIGGSRFVWSIEDIKAKVEKSKANRGKGLPKRNNRHHQLLGKYMDTIEEYIKYREYNPIVFNFVRIEEPGFFSEPIKDREKSRQSIILFRIIAGRAKIEDYSEKLTPHKLNFTDEERKMFADTVKTFELNEINTDDLMHLRIGLADRSYNQFCVSFKKMLYWHLSTFEKRSDFTTFKKTDEWDNIQHNIRSVISHMPHKTTIIKADPREKNYLKHDEILKMYRCISDGSGVISDPYKSSVEWMIGALCGVRPYEIVNLKLFDFWLDESTGLLKKFKYDPNLDQFKETGADDPDGFGSLYITRSKKMRSPSTIFLIKKQICPLEP
jgi:integrase